MSRDYHAIYATEAARYDALVTREDHEQNLTKALATLFEPTCTEAVELGAGTGRVTELIAPHCQHLRAFDASAHMLERARERLARFPHVDLAVADNAAIPLANATADAVLAGWTIGHLVGWHPADWPTQVDRVVQEMLRIAKPNALVVIIETLGTGQLEPNPPRPELGAYYQRLETEHGFQRTVLRTDYRFADLEEALALAGFFFGDTMVERIRSHHWVTLPEHTGLWSRRA